MVLNFPSTPLDLESLQASDYVGCFCCFLFLLSSIKIYAKDRRFSHIWSFSGREVQLLLEEIFVF